MIVTAFVSFPVSTHAVSFSPAIRDVEIRAGEVDRVTIKITNDSEDVVVTTFSVVPFTAEDNSGIPQIQNDSTYENWVVGLPDRIEMIPREQKSFAISISPPNRTQPGGHYFSIFATATPKQDSEDVVRATSAVGGLFFVHIPDRKETLHFTASKFRPVSTITFSIPQTLTFDLKNDSATHLIPQGEIRIAAFQGKKIYAIPLFTDKRVLPKQMRTFDLTWNPEGLWWSPLNPFRFGIYDVDLVLSNAPVDGTLRTRFILLSPSGILLAIALCSSIVWRYSQRSKK